MAKLTAEELSNTKDYLRRGIHNRPYLARYELLLAHIDALQAEIDGAWIPVSERLPEERAGVMGYFGDEYVSVPIFRSCCEESPDVPIWIFVETGEIVTLNVLKWREYPAPPKGSENEH